ncbi:MAG TPA: hypothetical protein VG963_01760 [Polyangiaceae bacterium]|nr:hypothetical protein [Polyangiaceae bacterium]
MRLIVSMMLVGAGFVPGGATQPELVLAAACTAPPAEPEPSSGEATGTTGVVTAVVPPGVAVTPTGVAEPDADPGLALEGEVLVGESAAKSRSI